MSGREYLERILAKYDLDEGQVKNLKARRANIENLLRSRIGPKVETVYYSGSYAKGTAINLGFDPDTCMYSSTTPSRPFAKCTTECGMS